MKELQSTCAYTDSAKAEIEAVAITTTIPATPTPPTQTAQMRAQTGAQEEEEIGHQTVTS